jgi:hypothetical protein
MIRVLISVVHGDREYDVWAPMTIDDGDDQ